MLVGVGRRRGMGMDEMVADQESLPRRVGVAVGRSFVMVRPYLNWNWVGENWWSWW